MANHDIMRNSNMISVFRTVQKHGPVTKKEIQTFTGLSWGSTSGIAAAILDAGIIKETDDMHNRLGRTPKTLEINSDKNFIIGIDINLQGITVTAIDLKGRPKAVFREPLQDTTRPVLMSQSEKLIRKILAGIHDRREVKGIGISFPGHVNQSTGTSVRIQHFDGFDGYPICHYFKNKFGLETWIDHDTNCIAMSERVFGSVQDTDNFLLVRMDHGIGMSTMFGGKILRGKSGATGEIGHMTMRPDGPRCQCGNNGCLETYASLRAIVDQCSEGAALGLSQMLSDSKSGTLCIQEIMSATKAGDAYCLSILNKAAAYTGIAIANVVNLFDPEKVVICGKLAAYDHYIDLVARFVQEKKWRKDPVNFYIVQNHDVSAAVGAAALFIEKTVLNELNRTDLKI